MDITKVGRGTELDTVRKMKGAGMNLRKCEIGNVRFRFSINGRRKNETQQETLPTFRTAF